MPTRTTPAPSPRSRQALTSPDIRPDSPSPAKPPPKSRRTFDLQSFPLPNRGPCLRAEQPRRRSSRTSPIDRTSRVTQVLVGPQQRFRMADVEPATRLEMLHETVDQCRLGRPIE